MGGPGSGRWFRLDTPKDTVEDCVVLNIFELTREGTIAWDKTCTGTFTAGELHYGISSGKQPTEITVSHEEHREGSRLPHSLDQDISQLRWPPPMVPLSKL